MCTVTLTSNNDNDFVLTSNRDESPDRVALVPDFYNVNQTKLLFPKDKKGGTWVGVSEKQRVVCVLNGAFVKHERKANYRKSRGIVANDFMTSDNIDETLSSYNLHDIEPFTMVIVDWSLGLKFYELIWDGKQKHVKALPLESKIWSSSTLYSESMQKERQQWFENFATLNELSSQKVLEFHSAKDDANMDYGIVMDRSFVKTTSITQVEKRGHTVTMRYENIESKQIVVNVFNLSEVVNG